MAFHSDFHIPGAFHTDGVHPGIFRPPDTSPASAASSGYLPTRSNQPTDEHANTKRKRFHDDFSTRFREQRHEAGPDPFGSPPVIRPSPATYMLAGQLDSPTVGPRFGNDMLEESLFSDSDYRRMLGTKRPRDEIDPNGSLFGLGPLTEPHQTPSRSWGALAVTAFGGVVGRIWQFCTAGSFKGFHAGGGGSYDLQPSVEDVSMLQDESYNDFEKRPSVPGLYPKASVDWSEGNTGDAYTHSRASTPTAPAPKRRQTAATDDLGKNWVIVKDPEASNTRSSTPDIRARRATGTFIPSPRNRNHAPAVTTGRRISTPASRRSTIPRPSMASTPTVGADRPTSAASFASPRSPSSTKTSTVTASASFSTPNKGHPARRRRSTASFIATPSHHRSNSGVSAAPNRGASAMSGSFEASPRLDPEAKKLAARRKREDDYADVRINAFNKTLQDMIRQGQEALATKVSVEGDGGWEDENL
ncbi:hypothetical protein ACO1O0_008316 [Amphichorda felina]